ncbi:Txe/YoeB family addiction module toxin [Azospirillum cavernae]|uniref:Putative mRNA interferase YoeB n=1 Tax=Azospirillum cavernae TaxID=2320860 RepID=A0A418VQ06_9PROT|nr:Txe/YoeB family addiction module toxin [Azospirillum cavernae]RJF78353.1 Txe/YoeB family addiction module toxin [Azospirillum cavernae]
MKTAFTDIGWNDYQHWIDADRDMLRRINDLIRDVKRTPFKGIGKPEPLKHSLKGWWSRRITGEHRLVYTVMGEGDSQTLVIAACRFHY